MVRFFIYIIYRKTYFMLNFDEIKDIIDALPMSVDKNDKEIVSKIRTVASQLGFALPERDCKCQDRYSDLSVKLKLWLKKHADGFCKYTMKLGIVRYTPFGNAYNLVLTDKQAEWILENDEEGSKFITRIVSDIPETSLESTKEDSNINYQTNDLSVPESAEMTKTQPKKTRKRKEANNG